MSTESSEARAPASAIAELEAEISTLRGALARAEHRAELAEEQLLRVHRAVQSVKQESRRVRRHGSNIIEGARVHATELVRQAEREARARRVGTSLGHRFEGWNDADPKLDEKLESYLQNDLEPDRSRDWILGDRSV
ncbi:MAG: hypothetical protein HKO87_08575 [Acidimicrobiia bacterium]|nr:hypothetical protein [Acidimicrobiia bacterium]